MSVNIRVLPRTIPDGTERLLLAAVQAGGQLVFDWDVEADRLRWLDLRDGTVFGHPAAHVSCHAELQALAHPEDLLSLQLARTALQNAPQQPVAVEFRLRAADGGWCWLECHGRLLEKRLVGIVTDVSARKATESRLAISALVLETIHDAILITSANGSILWVNSAAAHLLQLPVTELTGRPLVDFSADSRERRLELQQEIRDTVARTGRWRGRCNHLARDGSALTTEAVVTRVQGDDGELWIHVLRDLRQRIQMQQAALDSSRLEQERLGEVLQESLGQELTAAALMLRSLAAALPADESGRVAEVDRILRQSIEHCRQLAYGITPFVLGRHGLEVALQGLGRWAQQRGAAAVSVTVAEAANQVADSAAYVVHRVAQEIMTAACDLAPGAHFDIKVWQDGERIVATIADDVRRPNATRTAEEERMMAFRAESLGATLDTIRLPNGGRRVILQIPDRFVATIVAARAAGS